MSEEAAAHCYVAGAKKDSDTLLTAGGRVLGVTAVAPTLRAAVEDAYHLAEGVDFANKYCRGDIGSAALAAREERIKWYFGPMWKSGKVSRPSARRC